MVDRYCELVSRPVQQIAAGSLSEWFIFRGGLETDQEAFYSIYAAFLCDSVQSVVFVAVGLLIFAPERRLCETYSPGRDQPNG